MYFKTPFLYKGARTLHACEANYYILYPPFTSAEHGNRQTGFVNDWIFFEGERAKDIIEQFQLPLSTPFRIDDHSLLEPYINKIKIELTFKPSCYEERICALVTDMLIALGRQYEHSNRITHSSFEVIHNVRTYMLDHIVDKITVADLAKRANFSVSRFCCLYQQYFSSTPIDDLINARIEKAITLLKYRNTSISQTAELCGFSSIHYFSRKFKEKTGVAPSHYLNTSKSP